LHDLSSPFKATKDGVRMSVRLTPRARAARIDGILADADGQPVLKVAVTAPPEDGKANTALIALLAKEWRLPKSRISIAAGATNRRKSVMIEGDTGELMKRLSDWAKKIGNKDG
jgi:uncharacterized protein (TIGR00251 family)